MNGRTGRRSAGFGVSKDWKILLSGIGGTWWNLGSWERLGGEEKFM